MALNPADLYNEEVSRPHLKLIQGEHDDLHEHPVFADHELIEWTAESGVPTVSVGLENVLDGEDAEQVWEMYERGFRALNKGNLSRQSLTKDELLHQLEDSATIKYVARTDGSVVGLMTVEKGLHREQAEDWPLQDDELLDSLQAHLDPDAPSFFISTFVVDRQSDANHLVRVSELVLKGALLHFQEVCQQLDVKSCCFFDCAPENEYLMDYIMNCSKPTENFSGAEVEIWPVYCGEWYKIPLEDAANGKLAKTTAELLENAYADVENVRITSELPPEVQEERLEEPADQYCYVSDLAALLTEDNADKIDILKKLAETFPDKKYILADVKRLGARMEPLPIGERVGCQVFPVMVLKESLADLRSS